MAARDIIGRLGKAISRPIGQRSRRGFGTRESGALPEAPLGGTKAEAMQRLQIGVTGLAAVVAMVGLAGIIGGVADQAEEDAVPDAAPTTEPTAAPPQRDPLADAGVVPDIAVEPQAPASPRPKDREGGVTSPDGTVIVPDTPPTEPTGAPE